jgi:hypothetical protein
MKPRNKALHADCDRQGLLKAQILASKTIAQRHRVKEQTVRALISAAKKRHKSTSVVIHVEPDGERLR